MTSTPDGAAVYAKGVDLANNVWSNIKTAVSTAGQGARSVFVQDIGQVPLPLANFIAFNSEVLGALALSLAQMYRLPINPYTNEADPEEAKNIIFRNVSAALGLHVGKRIFG